MTLFHSLRPRPLALYQITLQQLAERRSELSGRDALAGAVAGLLATGQHDPDKHPALDSPDAQPLTVDEHLELLAVEESIRCHVMTGRGITIRRARQAGAQWADIAAALGADVAAAQAELAAWIAGQEHLWDGYPEDAGHRFGLRPNERPAIRALLNDDLDAR